MSAFFNHNQVSVKSIGKTVLIPDNDIARLMYYLSCVDTVINYGEDILSDYENYDLLTPTQKEVLVKLVEMFAPPFFIKAGVFILDQNLLPGNFNNEFYQITDQRIGIHINQEIMIGGRTVRVIRIINSYEESYNEDNSEYKEKMKEELKNEEDIKKCEIRINDKIIPFSYFHQFPKKGKYTIRYFFDKLTQANHLFKNCSSLISLDFSHFNILLTNMAEMFSNCQRLKK